MFSTRNPDYDENGPWCFVTDNNDFAKTYCDIPHCEGNDIMFKITKLLSKLLLITNMVKAFCRTNSLLIMLGIGDLVHFKF